MTEYERLLIETEDNGIVVVEKELDSGKGYYCDGVILINSRLSDNVKYCVLAEELGHHFTSYGIITCQDELKNKKQELVARRWGYEHLISLMKIIEAFELGAKNSYEMAELLGVTELFLNDCINDYKKKSGIGCWVDRYFIYFQPNLGVYKSFID